ncbi:MAG: hypothetical protein AAFX93_15860 [Verrucomicrobiota bacterium]
MKKLILRAIIAVSLLFVCLIAFLFLFPWPLATSSEILNRYVLNPTPEGTEIKELYYFNPSLGDGSILLELTLTENGMKEVLERYEWEHLDYTSAHLLRSFDVISEEIESDLLGIEVTDFLRIEINLKDSNTAILAATI